MTRLPLALPLLLLAACGGGRPTADAGPVERNARAGEVLTFDGSASRGGIDKYLWDFGDGSAVEQGAVVTHAFTVDGNYSVSLTVRGPGGVHSTSVQVNVGAGCNSTAVITVATTDPQPGSPVVFSAAGSKGCSGAALASYAWDFGDGVTESGDSVKASVSHTYAVKGVYQVALTVKDVNQAEGRATRTLGVGVVTTLPTVTCPGTLAATVGVATSFTASATDPAGKTITTYAWTFSDGGSASGSTALHTFAAAGSFTAQVVVTTDDGRASNPCTVAVTVTAPLDYSGSWLLNPAGGTLTGCPFTPSFPAVTLALTHAGTALTAAPSGNGWPSGTNLTGSQEPPPAAAGTFTVRATLPNESRSSPCAPVVPEHSVSLVFSSATAVSGTWKVVYSMPSCVSAGCIACNCVAQQTFTGIRQ